MSDLLSIGSSGVSAYRAALAAIGENVANAETPGYARREVRFQQSSNSGSLSPIYRESMLFSGVEAASVERAWDSFRAAEARATSAAANRASTREQWLISIENALADGPAGVGALLANFFNSAATLAANPDDRMGRSALLTALDTVAGAIRTTAESLGRVSDGIATAGRVDAEGLNSDLAALTKVNTALRQASDGGTSKASIEDERDRLIDSIAGRININVSIAGDGTASLTLAGSTGVTLLDPNSRALVILTEARDGRLSLSLQANGTETPLPATGGSLAGLVDVSRAAADSRRSLNITAEKFMETINSWSVRGRDINGNAGPRLLDMPGSATSLRLITTNPDRVAAASEDGTANGNLLVLATKRGAGGVESRWAELVSTQAQALAAAQSEASAAGTRRDNAYSARDEVTGVDLDHEAAQLVRFQQAYNGAAKVLQVARETMQSILDIF